MIESGTGDLRFEKPYVYQEAAGRRRTIEARYVLLADQRAAFKLAEYDRSLPLVIDPVLVYSATLAAGNGRGIAIDAAGNAYITGYTTSLNFPIVGGLTGANPMSATSAEVFVTKVNAAGTTIVYSTLFGGSGADQGMGIAVDNTGAAYIAGSTNSQDFPVVAAAQAVHGGNTDAFVAKLNGQGTALVYSTYLGGGTADSAAGIAVDKSSGAAFVTGVTNSNNFPTKSSYQAAIKSGRDAFITRLDPAGALVFSTYLGGSGDDYGQSVAIDGSNNLYVTGYTSSTNFPVTAGVVQSSLKANINAFITKLNGSGTALGYSTYLGGTCSDHGYGIAVHSSGSAYVTGETCSWDFPITTGVVQPQKNLGNAAFVTRLNADGTGMLYSTYLTGTRQARGTAIAVDETGYAYVTGFNYGENFPTVNAIEEEQEWYDVPILVSSSDGGVNWDSIDRGMWGTVIPAISIDPRDTKTFVAAESGINRTTDGGQNWTHTGLWNNTTTIARSASNADILYAATGNGIYKSTDNGMTWSRLGASPATTVNLLAVHPAEPSKLTAATSSGVFQSSDGVNWTAKNTGLLNLVVNDWDRSPADSKIQYVATGAGVFKTVDDAATWSLAGAGLPVDTSAFRLTVSPMNANTIYVLLNNNALYKSTDAGANWNAIGGGIKGTVLRFALAPSNPSILYAITSRAIYRSRDGGATWAVSFGPIMVFSVSMVEVDPLNADIVYAGLAIQNDVFVAKINQLGTAFAYSTLLGGQAGDAGMGIAADSSGNAYVSGTGNSPFPTTAGSFSRIIGGAFIAKIADTKPPCTYVIRPGDAASDAGLFYSGGGEGRFFVIAPSGCAWQVNSAVPWITVPGDDGGEGVGVGPVWIDVDANTGPARQGTVTVGGQAYIVKQAGGACAYERAVEALAVPAAGGTFTVPITTTADCDWLATANQGWMSATPAAGSGSGSVTITVLANPGASARVAAVVIGGSAVMVSQMGATSTFIFNPAAVNVPAGASTGSVAVATNLTSANWRPVSTASWLAVTSGLTFTGSVSVNYAVAANTGTAPRTAQIIAGDTVFTVTQAGLPGTTPMITSVNAAGGGPDIALNTWIEIKGANLAPTDLGPYGLTWSTAPEFASGKMPVQLRNVSVTVNGKPCYVYFISPAQVNVLTGLATATAEVQVVVTNNTNSSLPFKVNMRTGAPGFFLLGATRYIAATHGNGSLLGPASMSVPGYTFSPAKPNETVVLYANGFGLPSTPLEEGSATQLSALPSMPVILIGGILATVAYAGVVAPGLYQFNVVVPADAPDGDNAVTATYAGFTTAPGALITVQK